MDESNMKRSLRRVVIFFCSIGLIYMVGAYALIKFSTAAFNEIAKERMLEEVMNYKKQVEIKIERNFQMMNTIASLIEDSKMNLKYAAHGTWEQIEWHNNFLLFGFFDLEGAGIFYGDGIKYEIDLDDTQEQMKALVNESFQGNQGVSDVFFGNISRKDILVFSVPVYFDGEIGGALVVSDDMDIFSEALGEKKIFSGNGYVHLVDSNGEFIVHAREMEFEEGESIFEEPYLSGDEVEKIQNLMKKSEKAEFSFGYNDDKYQALLEPLEINGWYLLCVNSAESVNQMVYKITNVIKICLGLIVILCLVTLIYIYKIMQKNNRQLKRYAYFDELTGLYNIRHFLELAEEASKRQKDYTIVVLNIRQFKFINEIFGKEQADKLLYYIGQILMDSIKKDEFVCRESADSFYLFLTDIERSVVESRLTAILERITSIKGMNNTNYRLMMRCGIADSTSGEKLQDVMTHAMFALAKVKENPQQSMWFFDSALHKQEQEDNYIERHFYKAMENKEFKLYLQPKIDLKNNKLSGAESLTRWIQDDGKMIYPGSFIPLFESNGFCVELDLYMFEEVCRQIREWLDNGYEVVPISVNQSKITFYKDNYVQKLCSIMNKYKVPASLIIIEILESLAIDNIEELNRRLVELKQLGFQISMDDFGTGYSSLNTLAKLKIDEVKLDRGFLIGAMNINDKNTRLIMEEIVQLSKKLSISTVIEGIETIEDVEFVKQIRCDKGQGYFYSRPVSADIFTKEVLKKKS